MESTTIKLINGTQDDLPDPINNIIEQQHINPMIHKDAEQCYCGSEDMNLIILYANSEPHLERVSNCSNIPKVLISDNNSILESAFNLPFDDYIHTSDPSFRPDILESRFQNILFAREDDTKDNHEINTESLAHLLEHSPELIVVTDEEMNVKYMNAGTNVRDSISSEGRTLEEILNNIHPDDQDRVLSIFESTCEEPDCKKRTEFRIRHENGDDWVWFESINQNMMNHEEIQGIYCVMREIDESKEQEIKIKRQRDKLDNIVSILSHDLRNLINVAKARSEIVLQDNPEDENVRAMERSIERMSQLIEDSLQLTDISETVEDVEFIRLDDLATECYNNIICEKNKNGDYTINCETKIDIKGDRSRLSNLLENLFKNAIHHNSDNIHIDVGLLDDENGFFVEDDGKGIPDDKKENVFNKGYTSGDGSGLGLNIVRQIAEAHDWNTNLTDSSTGGARFEFTNVDLNDAD